MPFPARLSEVTVDWLNDVLVEKRILTTERVAAFTVEPVPLQGLTCSVHVLTLSYDRPSARAPQKLILKISTDNPAARQALAANRGYQREVSFYSNIGSDAGIPVPACYAARYNAEDDSCVLLLDYIDNTCQKDVFSGVPEDVDLAVEHLAALHAGWWGRERELESRGIVYAQAPFLLDIYLEKLTAALGCLSGRYRTDAGPTLMSLLDLWLPNARLFADHFRKGPLTLCHGDFHRNQILFPVAGRNPFCVIDWQLVTIDSGATDLAHILVTGLFPDQRRARERELVEKYYALLLQHGVIDCSIDRIREQYALGVVKLALFYLTTFAMGDVQPIVDWWAADEKHKGVSFWDMLCGWPSRALEEHGALELLEGILRSQK